MPLACLPHAETTTFHPSASSGGGPSAVGGRGASSCSAIVITWCAVRGDVAHRDVALAAVDEAFPGLLI